MTENRSGGLIEGYHNAPYLEYSEAIAIFEVAQATRDERSWQKALDAVYAVSGRKRNPKTIKPALRVAVALMNRIAEGKEVDISERTVAEVAQCALGYDITARRVRHLTDWFVHWQAEKRGLDGARTLDFELGPHQRELFQPGQQFEVWLDDDRMAYVRAVLVEAIPPSSGSVINFGPLGPEDEIVKLATEALNLRPNELVRLHIAVEDDVQVTLEEARSAESSGRQGLRRMVDAFTRLNDPELESTLFWLYGSNRQLQIKVRNPTKYPLQRARVSFYGWRMLTEKISEPDGRVVEAITRSWT